MTILLSSTAHADPPESQHMAPPRKTHQHPPRLLPWTHGYPRTPRGRRDPPFPPPPPGPPCRYLNLLLFPGSSLRPSVPEHVLRSLILTIPIARGVYRAAHLLVGIFAFHFPRRLSSKRHQKHPACLSQSIPGSQGQSLGAQAIQVLARHAPLGYKGSLNQGIPVFLLQGHRTTDCI